MVMRSGPQTTHVGNLELSIIPTAVRSDADQPPSGPRGLCAQSYSRTAAAIAPPPSRKRLASSCDNSTLRQRARGSSARLEDASQLADIDVRGQSSAGGAETER